MSPTLRPCLKGGSPPASNLAPIPSSSSASQCDISQQQLPSSTDYFALPYAQPFVHFPPTPTMTTTHVVDPPQLYDRTPIQVSENDCELPKRGCPGRTYTLQAGCPLKAAAASAAEGFAPRSNHHHPSAMFTPRTMLFNDRPSSHTQFAMAMYGGVPALVSDESSSSEESDGLVSPPPEPSSHYPQQSLYCHPLCVPHSHSPFCPIFADTGAGARDPSFSPNPMAFLPHPPRPKAQPAHTAYTHHIPTREQPPPMKKRTRTAPAYVPSGWDNSSCLGGF